ncbi:glycoside hydrolase family 99-like domain-containing protein [Stenotrophomonas sp. HITSZ_GD]|uniref:glycoside hydrolase family 99-like domain-containing protein n=1 Tax=Stenotrophomonas sp. HITSZ_GD TaxID=3037248 RepID=UPI00240DBC62|nr:glycoside hydrolase family 99-like domain-containing protein [Stenotrophomonas sp. HITSZ_GD]MDG2525653.1 glycoside hydrolase family 99-like domain-containing protein [Stenotrophomonas sp. HITSZ_GD]
MSPARPPGEALRHVLYRALRTAFRALPLDDATRDRWRARFLSRGAAWAPPPPKGKAPAAGDGAHRPLMRADEAAIGHVPYRQEALPATLPATLVAFYLPQFHPIPENDRWWGKGFTEWRNVTRALPQFEGHAQPRLPADLGFYDLRDIGVMREQARLAREYGIGAFCFYYYWFAGQTLLEQPLQQWLADDGIDLPFCLCWANENWARRWDGRDHDVLMAQQHSAEDDLAFIAHVAPYLRDRRALRVDGRPMLLVYRPSLMPDPAATAKRWREWCSANGIGEIHLAYVQGFERPDPRDIGFDAAVEFPPNMSSPPSVTAAQTLINPDFAGDVLDWRELAREASQRPLPAYRLYPGVNPGWDNEPRRSGKGRVLLHASPRGYGEWLQRTIHERLAPVPPAQRLVFINAWNEWAEGAVLEPDMRLGYAWLEATRNALHARVSGSSAPCVVIHAFYPDVLNELLMQLHSAAFSHRLVITTTEDKAKAVHDCLQARGMQGEVCVFENRGRDVLPFLRVADRLLNEGVSLVLKLHTKRSLHRQDGDDWRREMVGALLAPERASAIMSGFANDSRLGLVAPEGHIQPLGFYWGANERRVRALAARIGIDVPDVAQATFASGSMFWARLEALRPLLDLHPYASEFEAEAGQVDGTLAHAIERLFSLGASASGYRVVSAAGAVGQPEPAAGTYRYARRG